MCTAISLLGKSHYFGRNLDLEFHYKEEVVITPSAFHYPFRYSASKESNYPMIGMATVVDGIPLYYDATNIHGLSIAGLNFPGNSVYHPYRDGADNIASFELIPWILRQCKSVSDAGVLLSRINILNNSFNRELTPTPLHWLISDSNKSIVIESTESGVTVFDNPVNVLTNSPPFPYHLCNLCNYLNITNLTPTGDLASKFKLTPYSNGMGGIGLPGDYSSASRFVKAAFLLCNSCCPDSEMHELSQFFHILDSVAHPRGSVIVNGQYEITYYSSCCNTTKGIYYYKTYENARINAVDMQKENLDQDTIIRYPLRNEQDIFLVNH